MNCLEYGNGDIVRKFWKTFARIISVALYTTMAKPVITPAFE
jgi:hypothetical protein